MGQIARFGTTEQKNKWLPRMCSGEIIGALSMSEPNSGSDVVSMKASAEWDEDKKEFTINGTKMWCTNGPEANVIVLYAKTKKHDETKAITAFLIDTKAPGFSTAQKLDKVGMRGSNTCELVFDNYKVSVDNVLGGKENLHKGVYIMMVGLDYERAILSAGPVGIMQGVLEMSLD